jgi:hypothetical protein
MSNTNTVSKIYTSQIEIETAVRNLLDQGFSVDRLSVVLPSGKRKSVQFLDKGNPLKTLSVYDDVAIGIETGALIGSAAGLFAGLGLLGISNVGGLLLSKPIGLVLTGLAIGAIFGGLGGGLVGWSLSQNEERNYERYLSTDGLMLVVHTSDDQEIEKAEMLLQKTFEQFAPVQARDYHWPPSIEALSYTNKQLPH